jgi:hypothetical protein
MEDIPDPAERIARRPAPEAAPPAERSPTRRERSLLSAIALVLSAIWLVAGAAELGLRQDLGAPAIGAPLALLMLLAGAALALTVRPRHRGLPAGLRALRAAVLALPAAFVALVLIGARWDEPAPPGSTAPCLLIAGGLSLVPIALAALVLQRSFLSAPAWRGAAVGAICGLAGAIVIQAHCPYTAAAHVVLAHGLPILGGAALGAAAGTLGGRV